MIRVGNPWLTRKGRGEQTGVTNGAGKLGPYHRRRAEREGSSALDSHLTNLEKYPRHEGLTSPSYCVQAARMTKNNILSRFSSAHLKRAAAVRERIDKLEKELTGILGIPESMTVGGMVRRHRRMSKAARAKLSAAAKARWAKVRAKKS